MRFSLQYLSFYGYRALSMRTEGMTDFHHANINLAIAGIIHKIGQKEACRYGRIE